MPIANAPLQAATIPEFKVDGQVQPNLARDLALLQIEEDSAGHGRRCIGKLESSEGLPPVRLVDFHCEITSEKNAMGVHLDGRVSAVVGTHTHVPTADDRILPGGTAYQSDLGCTGPAWSIIGFDPATVLPRFLNGLPTRFEVGDGSVIFNATQVDIDPATGRALAIERIQQVWEA